MKNLVRTYAASAALLFTATQTQALEMPELEECVTIPQAVFHAPLTTTVVGLYADGFTTPNAKVYWGFFDGSGAQRANGDFSVNPNTLSGFILSSAASPAEQGVDGFLLFCLDNDGNATISGADGDHLAGSAFFVDTSNNDVAFTPVIETRSGNLNQPTPALWGTGMPIGSIEHNNDIDSTDTVTMQYAINGIPDNGDDTRIHIFSTTADMGPSQVMTIYNSSGISAPLANVLTPNPYLNIIDPETVAGVDAVTFPTGFINWLVPGAFSGDAYAFSVLKSPAFSATQTLVSIVSE